MSGKEYVEEKSIPKLKTNKSAAKRFTVTGSGKVKRRKGNLRHILTKKNSKRKNDLGKDAVLNNTQEKNARRLMPYAF